MVQTRRFHRWPPALTAPHATFPGAAHEGQFTARRQDPSPGCKRGAASFHPGAAGAFPLEARQLFQAPGAVPDGFGANAHPVEQRDVEVGERGPR
jgi:hypothetical protein